MKNKTYYLVLIILIFCIVGIGYFFNLVFKYYIKYWIASIGVLVLYMWCKDIFTGRKWFEKPNPTKPGMIESMPMYGFNEGYEESIENSYQPFSEKEKEGYITLAKFCLAPQKQNELIAFFETLGDFSESEEDMTRLNYVMEYCDSQNLHFIMSLDWKSAIEDLEWRVENSLNNNFNLSIDLPKPENYGDEASISFENVFEDFDKPLRNIGLQIGFIDTQSDEYVIFLHKLSDKEKVENAINKIGYKYYEKMHCR